MLCSVYVVLCSMYVVLCCVYVVFCVCCAVLHVVLCYLQRATKLDFHMSEGNIMTRGISYICFMFMKVYRRPQCKDRRAVLSSLLL